MQNQTILYIRFLFGVICFFAITGQSKAESYYSKDIIRLPKATPSLAISRKSCIKDAATYNYKQAQISCLSYVNKLKADNEKKPEQATLKLCGFYVGLFSHRLKYNAKSGQARSISDLLTNLSDKHDHDPDAEQDLVILLKALNLNINIEKWCKKAAFQNSGYAMEILGDFYEQQYRYDDAIYWYRRSIESYSIAPQNGGISSTYALGALLALSPQPTRHPQKAASLLLQSVTLGDDSFLDSYIHSNCKLCLPVATRLNIQKILKQQGLYNGAVDGDFGPNTVRAIISLSNPPNTHIQATQ